MGAAGFDDRGLPDGRVLRMCAGPEATTVSQIGRELGISRQGASKSVASLRQRGYVTVSPSATNGREKDVALTERAVEYLAAQRRAVRTIERQLRAELGAEAFAALQGLLSLLGGDEQPRLRDYLEEKRHTGGAWEIWD